MKSDQKSSLGLLEKAVNQALGNFRQNQVQKRLFEKDSTLWKKDDPAHQRVIQNRLGWLSSGDWLASKVDHLISFQKEIKRARFTHVVLLGMGGSSLAPEVFRETFGRSPGFPKFILLDSTDPDQVLRTEKSIHLTKTLFIVSSKSGTTLETASFYKYFFEKLRAIKGTKAGENFIAITDPGATLEKEAHELKFFRLFINPADVGGRFSVLSYFGMVPAVAMGLPVKKIIERIKDESDSARTENSDFVTPAVLLGLVMGEGSKIGRNKLTIVMSKKIYSYGLWVEQMIAESLGKEGKGVIPVFGEKLLDPEEYQNDRIFVSLSCGSKEPAIDAKLKKLEASGQPVIRIQLKDIFDLGRQFFRWALATAVAGVQMGVNPFDEPNVQQAKDWTKKFLDELKENGKFLDRKAQYRDKYFDITLGEAVSLNVSSDKNLITSFVRLERSGDYFDIAAYLPYEAKSEKTFQEIRAQLQAATQRATMFGFGPRYLHSTGQLHKGGPNSCLVILITADSKGNAKIPGQSFGFRELEYAQALGDFHALGSKGRRAIHIHLKAPVSASLVRLKKLFKSSLTRP